MGSQANLRSNRNNTGKDLYSFADPLSSVTVQMASLARSQTGESTTSPSTLEDVPEVAIPLKGKDLGSSETI